jgi:DNA-binding NarL/FixJ family response regulator
VAEFARLAPAAPQRVEELVEPLSEREIEILKLVSQGLTNKEIAAKLYLAEGTVKNYFTSILQKIEARDRTQAAIRGREVGLL